MPYCNGYSLTLLQNTVSSYTAYFFETDFFFFETEAILHTSLQGYKFSNVSIKVLEKTTTSVWLTDDSRRSSA
jgi:hypothetical protein